MDALTGARAPMHRMAVWRQGGLNAFRQGPKGPTLFGGGGSQDNLNLLMSVAGLSRSLMSMAMSGNNNQKRAGLGSGFATGSNLDAFAASRFGAGMGSHPMAGGMRINTADAFAKRAAEEGQKQTKFLDSIAESTRDTRDMLKKVT